MNSRVTAMELAKQLGLKDGRSIQKILYDLEMLSLTNTLKENEARIGSLSQVTTASDHWLIGDTDGSIEPGKTKTT